MSQLVLELFSEEIPSSMQENAANDLLKSVLNCLKLMLAEHQLTGEAFSTPRRIGFYIQNIPSFVEQQASEVKGPKITANQTAIEGFMKKYGLTHRSQLTEGREFFFYTTPKAALESKLALKKIIEESLKLFVWPKSMRWGSYEIKWARPLHSLLCLLGGEVIPVKYGHLTASNKTYGHRFMSSKTIEVKDANTYHEQLQSACVELLPAKRQEVINKGLKEAEIMYDLKVIDDAELLNEVCGLVEHPVVLIGEISSSFMRLPKEVLVTSLRNNQKYFMFEKKDGSLAPYFGITANIETADRGQNIVKDNEKVLAARLSDAQFFYQQDLKIRLENRLNSLKTLMFHTQIGSVYDKMQSTQTLAIKIAELLGASLEKVSRAALLAKADLLTEMVKEFTELQGTMGYYYATEQGEDNQVALAIKEHYKPKGPSDTLPQNVIGTILALAEKLDTLEQMFAIDIKPTGSKDPYALRRAAIGINRIIKENELQLELSELGLRQDVLAFIASKAS